MLSTAPFIPRNLLFHHNSGFHHTKLAEMWINLALMILKQLCVKIFLDLLLLQMIKADTGIWQN